jgi:Uncharacterised protein family (UPF0139)
VSVGSWLRTQLCMQQPSARGLSLPRHAPLQWQLGGWAALICTLQSLANMKTKDWDIKQVISAMT